MGDLPGGGMPPRPGPAEPGGGMNPPGPPGGGVNPPGAGVCSCAWARPAKVRDRQGQAGASAYRPAVACLVLAADGDHRRSRLGEAGARDYLACHWDPLVRG